MRKPPILCTFTFLTIKQSLQKPVIPSSSLDLLTPETVRNACHKAESRQHPIAWLTACPADISRHARPSQRASGRQEDQ